MIPKELTFTPILSWTLLVLLVTIVIGAFGWSFFYGLRSKQRIILLWSMRIAAVLALFVVMLQPQQRRDEIIKIRTQLAILIDATESMNDPVDKDQPIRSERVQLWLKTKALQDTKRDLDLRVFAFGAADKEVPELSADTKELKFTGGKSDLLNSILKVQDRLKGQPVAGLLVLSDGLDTTIAGKVDSIPSAMPVYTFELEKKFKAAARKKRISVDKVEYPQRLVLGRDADVQVSLKGTGMNGMTVPVELWRDGVKYRDTTVSFNEDDEQARDASFQISHEKTGRVQYEMRVIDPAADKQAKSYPFLIEVLEPGNRVLYVQNNLGFEYKFLRKAITTDRNLQLNAFARYGDKIVSFERGVAGASAQLEISGQALSKFAVVILGDLAADSLRPDQLTAIRDFVYKGGGLVLLGGSNGFTPAWERTPLKELLPVRLGAGTENREGKFPVEITDVGKRHPVFGPLFEKVKDFEPLLTCNTSESVPPMAEVLMQVTTGGRQQPVIVAQKFNQGRVVAVMTDTIWRWRLGAKSWTSDKSPYDTFWTQLMDWLIPKEQNKQNSDRLDVFTERTTYQQGEKPEVRAILNQQTADAKQPATLPLQIRSPDDKVLEYTLRSSMLQVQGGDGKQVPGYRIEVDPHMPGVYSAKVTATVNGIAVEGETRFVVKPPATEITGKPINEELLKKIAEATKGKYYTLDAWESWPKDLHYEEQHVSRVQIMDLWNHPFMLILVLGLMAADWATRKFWSLP